MKIVTPDEQVTIFELGELVGGYLQGATSAVLKHAAVRHSEVYGTNVLDHLTWEQLIAIVSYDGVDGFVTHARGISAGLRDRAVNICQKLVDQIMVIHPNTPITPSLIAKLTASDQSVTWALIGQTQRILKSGHKPVTAIMLAEAIRIAGSVELFVDGCDKIGPVRRQTATTACNLIYVAMAGYLQAADDVKAKAVTSLVLERMRFDPDTLAKLAMGWAGQLEVLNPSQELVAATQRLMRVATNLSVFTEPEG